jgi:hypothetical protein
MNPQVPWLAKWLLDRYGVTQNESLMGDLIEERASGRSSSWFWRQTLVAIGGTVFRDLRNHKLLALRAIAVGWTLQIALLPYVFWGGYKLSQHHPTVSETYVAHVLFALFNCLVGWVIARTHRAYPLAMILASAATWGIFMMAWFGLRLWSYYELRHIFPWNLVTDQFASVFLSLAGGLLIHPRPKRRIVK